MANKIVLADTSILIDYFRKTDKSNAVLIALFDQGYDFCISAVTHYEIYSDAAAAQLLFWRNFLAKTTVLPFDELVAEIAVDINNALKRKSKQIEIADLFIAATAISANLPLATLNRKHFQRINELVIVN